MKVDVAILVEALRRAQAKVAFYLEPGRDQSKGLQELAAILEDKPLLRAMRGLSHGHSYVATPEGRQEPNGRREEVAPAPPLSR
jgi:hypothetical protein